MLRRPPLFLFLLLFTISSLNSIKAQTKAEFLEEALGDLDGDDVNERVVVYSTDSITDNGRLREVHIFKKTANDWTLWQQKTGVVMASEAGGALGDPFVSVEIKDGQLVFYHTGGETEKWNYTHHFRFLDGVFELVSAKISFGTLCDSFTNIDFDLLSGLLSYKQESDNCSQKGVNQLLVDKKVLAYLDELPKMQGFLPGDNRMEVPGTSLVFFY
ncbi:MAG: hypothetical protein HEP71_03625 [Roseivirga sp.]|nr:hypothetical protein [Roseivirga sp.]